MKESEMLEPIKRLMPRQFPSYHKYYILQPEAVRYFPYSEIRNFTRADLVYLQGRLDRLHVIEFEPTLSRAFEDDNHGVYELNNYKGNYKWIAIPISEYLLNPDWVRSECYKRKLGLIVVHPCSSGLTAKVKINAPLIKGKYLYHWPEICSLWNQCNKGKSINNCPFDKDKCRF